MPDDKNPQAGGLKQGLFGKKYLISFLRWTAVACVIGGALAVLRAHTFHCAQGHDEAIFLYGGQAWAAGQVPYRDFWDHKPPHIFLFHALPLWLFPFSRTAAVVNEIVWLALAGTVFAAVCRRHLSVAASAVAVAFFCLFVSHRVAVRSGGMTEEASLLFVALSYWMILRPSPRLRRDVFWAGLFLGMAAEFRQTYGLSLLFLAAVTVWRARELGWKTKPALGSLALVSLGFVLPEAFWSAWFAAKRIWWDYFEASYLFNLIYIGAEPETHTGWLDGLRTHWRVLCDTGPMLAAPVLAAALLPWLPREKRWWCGLLLPAFVCEFAPVSLSGEYYHHYYVQTTISTCLLMGFAAQAVGEIVAGVLGRRLSEMSRIKAAAGLLPALAVLAAAAWLTVGGVRCHIAENRKLERRNALPTGDRALEQSLGQALAGLTAPDERILLLGVQPNACYFAAKRYAGARYFHNAPLFKGKFQGHISERMKQAMLADLQRHQPVLILLGLLEGADKEWLGMELVRRRAPFLVPYLMDNYVPLETLGGRIPRDWFWYEDTCAFLVRKDLAETVRARLDALPASP
ncbi:MAG: hypothetical protein N3D11_03420 [Candidatus Sumerlaeia bacterium]|nr:hypothetical protein [Candidatus Sumerlaeia bacterium]